MKKIFSGLLNILFFTVIAILAISVATIALTKKVNEYRAQNTAGIQGTVVKLVIPVLSMSKGIVTSVEVKTGDKVTQNDVLIQVDNPLLRTKVNSLKEFPGNVSAQTEAKVAQEELNNLTIASPTNGIVGNIYITSGGPVDTLSKTMEIYSNDDVRLLAELTIEEYQEVQKLQKIKAYSARLNQNFPIKIEKLRPDEKDPTEVDKKKIGLYFTFVNKEDAASLLHNEDLELKLTTNESIDRPIDFFVNFWNGLLSLKD